MQNRQNGLNAPSPILLRLILVMLIVMQLMACATSSEVALKDDARKVNELETRWGIHLEGIRLTAIGHLVDFRFRILDPDKAEHLMHRGDEAYLIDEATNAKLPVPLTRVGRLRGTGTKPIPGRVYAVMFASGGVVKRGSEVTVVLGDFRVENLTVQ